MTPGWHYIGKIVKVIFDTTFSAIDELACHSSAKVNSEEAEQVKGPGINTVGDSTDIFIMGLFV